MVSEMTFQTASETQNQSRAEAIDTGNLLKCAFRSHLGSCFGILIESQIPPKRLLKWLPKWLPNWEAVSELDWIAIQAAIFGQWITLIQIVSVLREIELGLLIIFKGIWDLTILNLVMIWSYLLYEAAVCRTLVISQIHQPWLSPDIINKDV